MRLLFRLSLFAIAAHVWAIVAFAQGPFSCQLVTQTPTLLRLEGVTELTGDLLLTCTGGTANLAVPVQLSLYASASVTSKVLAGGSEVLLLVNEPAPAARALGANTFEGQLVGNSVTWNVSLVEPGSGTLTLRITNVRVNANSIGVPTSLLGAIEMAVGGTTTTVGTTVLGYTEISAGIDLRRCDDGDAAVVQLPIVGGLNPGLLAANGSGHITLNARFTEGFANVFRSQLQESGTLLTGEALTADHGTRFALTITGIPANVQVFATTGPVTYGNMTSPTFSAALVNNASGPYSAASASETGACPYVTGTSPMAAVPVNLGTATAVWEVTASSIAAVEQASFGIAFAYSDTTTIPLGLAPLQFIAGLAPEVAINSSEIPRFLDNTFFINDSNSLAAFQNGLTFVGTPGGAGNIQPESVALPSGTIQVTSSTTDGGKWLPAPTINGSSISVAVDPTGLSAGDYFGQVNALTAQNTVIGVASVVLHLVLQSPGPIVYPQGLIFPDFVGDTQSDPQVITITNVTGQNLTYTQTNPPGAGQIKPGATASIPITVNVASLPVGQYATSTSFSFSDGTSRNIPIKTVIAPLPGNSGSGCPYFVTPASFTPPAAGGTVSAQISTSGGCHWSVTGLPSWITATPASGSGTATVTLQVAANNGSARAATIGIAGSGILIQQPIAAIAGYTIASFLAGIGSSGAAEFNLANGIAVDSAGTIYLAADGVIEKVTNGIPTIIAGMGAPGYSGDNGPAASAAIYAIGGIAVDSGGNIYFSDYYNCVRKISSGIITTVAGICNSHGSNNAGFSGDNGPAVSALLNQPQGVAVDSSGNLYIADYGNGRVRKVSGGVITTIVDQLNEPLGVALNANGDLYISDYTTFRVLTGGKLYSLIGGSGQPSIGRPGSMAVASNGVVFLAGNSTGQLFTWTPGATPGTGTLATIAGTGTSGYSGDKGPALQAQLSGPIYVAVNAAGNIYVSEYNDPMRLLTPGIVPSAQSYNISTFAGKAGQSGYSGDNGPPSAALVGQPVAVAVDRAGNLYIADNENNVVRQVSGGLINTVAGDGALYGFGPYFTPAIATALNPTGLATDSSGSLYISDSSHNDVVQVFENLTTIPGSTVSGLSGAVANVVAGVYGPGFGGAGGTYSGDNGPAIQANLNSPYGIAVDTSGNLYIADYQNSVIRKVDKNGIITTVAGGGTGGDGGQATSAKLLFPDFVAVDANDNLYICEFARIRVVSNGIIYTIAGNGSAGFAGEGITTGGSSVSQVASPAGMAFGPDGALYFTDLGNNVVRKWAPVAGAAPNVGVLTTVAGNRIAGYSGDGGSALSAQLNSPAGLAFDPSGNLYVADAYNNVVRILTPAGASPPASSSLPLQTELVIPLPRSQKPKDTSGCTPTYLTAVFRELGAVINLNTGSPQPVEVTVYDSCSQPFQGAPNRSVQVQFSNGDNSAPLGAPNQVAGVWAGTWVPAHYASQVTATATVAAPDLGLTTTATEIDNLIPTGQPLVGGIASAATGSSPSGLAPGEFISIYGSNLASGTISGGAPPYTSQLGGTRVQVNGEYLPLSFAGPTQINAIIPYDFAAGSTAEAIVENSTQTSVSIPISIAAVDPAIFYEVAGGQGAITNALTGTIADVLHPVTHGTDYIAIYCSGLGAVSPAIAAGQAAPLAPPFPAVIAPVSVTIGGVPAIVSYQGLSPGFAGLYQVNAQVPVGVQPGNAVQVTVSVAGQTSPAATIAVR